MTDFFYEYEVSKKIREIEALDRRLEKWGWYRRGHHVPEKPGWRFRLGATLVRAGCWLQGVEEPKQVPGTR